MLLQKVPKLFLVASQNLTQHYLNQRLLPMLLRRWKLHILKFSGPLLQFKSSDFPIFTPQTSKLRFESEEEVIKRANDTRYGLAGNILNLSKTL